MGIPPEYHIFFCILSIILLLIIIILLFMNPTFDTTTAGFIICFLNVVIASVAGYGFFAFDLYGYDSSGVLVENLIYEYDFLGMIFIIIAYICVILMFYCVWLWYKKPWKDSSKVEGNPYVYYKN